MKNLIALITTFLTLVLAVNTFASDYQKLHATGESYFDVATGHRYIKNSNDTYSEYTKKGELFRSSIPNHLPLLTTNKYIREIGDSCYFLYEKRNNHIIKSQILPASSEQPKGWYLKAAIACLKSPETKDTGFGYLSTLMTFSYNDKKVTATGDTYFDVATGHRYVKNPDCTYTEYTKKGAFFRSSVPNYLPLLTSNKYIRELRKNCYLLYTRNINQKTETLVLPPDQEHPIGWAIEKMLVSMNQ